MTTESTHSSHDHLEEEQQGERRSEDRINQLQDDILIIILSFLTVREAVATSCLSSRWRHLWVYTSHLDFDGTKTMMKIGKNRELVLKERQKFSGLVNHVIKLHNSPTLEVLRFAFDLNSSSKFDIDSWLQFAISKKVKKLTLHFSNDYTFLRSVPYDAPYYKLSAELLGHYGTLSSDCSSMQPHTFLGFRSLTSLHLKKISLSQQVLDFLLSNSPALATLTLHDVYQFSYLKVVGPSFRLKHLEISRCFDLDRIEICNTKYLVSVSYYEHLWQHYGSQPGEKGGMFLRNVPNLVKLSCEVNSKRNFVDIFRGCRRYFSKLEHLVLGIHTFPDYCELDQIGELTKLSQLKLVVDERIYEPNEEGLLVIITSLLRAAPYLQKFGLKVKYESYGRGLIQRRKFSQVDNWFSHQYLKIVEFHGYFGETLDLKLITYLVENAPNLETIVVDPALQFDNGITADDPHIPINEERALASAEQQLIKSKVPAHINLVIL